MTSISCEQWNDFITSALSGNVFHHSPASVLRIRHIRHDAVCLANAIEFIKRSKGMFIVQLSSLGLSKLH